MAEYENKQPCNYFANTPTKNVPLRCANANVTENPNEKTNN